MATAPPCRTRLVRREHDGRAASGQPGLPVMMTSSPKPYTFLRALGVGVRSMRAHPVLAFLLLAATISQGTMQGLIVWALRKVLMMFGQGKGGSASLVFGGALL